MSTHIPDELYKKILENMPVCCVDLVIVNGGKVLLLYRKDEPAKDQWWFPGGRILKNERLFAATIRKASEETGLDIRIEKQVGAYETLFEKGPYPDLKTGVHTPTVVYLASLKNSEQEVKINETSTSYKWIEGIDEHLDSYVKKVLIDSGVFD